MDALLFADVGVVCGGAVPDGLIRFVATESLLVWVFLGSVMGSCCLWRNILGILGILGRLLSKRAILLR